MTGSSTAAMLAGVWKTRGKDGGGSEGPRVRGSGMEKDRFPRFVSYLLSTLGPPDPRTLGLLLSPPPRLAPSPAARRHLGEDAFQQPVLAVEVRGEHAQHRVAGAQQMGVAVTVAGGGHP